jgi:hypothetical protein
LSSWVKSCGSSVWICCSFANSPKSSNDSKDQQN